MNFCAHGLLTHVRQSCHDAGMSQPQMIPDWSLGWRLRRSLEWAEVSAKQMAGELDVSEGTISRWCHDVGAPPRTIYLRAWAAKCRVPLEWLESGDEGLPRVDSNHQPAVLELEPSPSHSEILAFRKTVHRPLHQTVNYQSAIQPLLAES